MRLKYWVFKENRILDVQNLRLFNDDMNNKFTTDGFCVVPWEMKHYEDYHFQFDGKLLFDSGLKDYDGVNLFDGDMIYIEYKNQQIPSSNDLIIFKVKNYYWLVLNKHGNILEMNDYNYLLYLNSLNGHRYDFFYSHKRNFWTSEYNNIDFWKNFKKWEDFNLWYEDNKQWFDNFLEFKKWKL